ncbi:lactonase family protein [Paenibacillus thalictri]|uniref:Lactonase family protein n=1 Tax=Paenibacillus thalictri TaxID=2527873 RepID=A0A4Q9DNY9_9BACL|nr:lactonase family protein [Paenibacillus thalictri]TBL75322.1 lactonase family protein [Paenibacillus thalictri]
MANHANRQIVFIGSYAEPGNPGIYVYSMNNETGELTLLDSYSDTKNPSFLDVDHENKRLYAIGEAVLPGEQESKAVASAFSFDPETGKLSFINRQATVGTGTCHIQLDPLKRFVVATSYRNGLIGMLPVREDGSLGVLADSHAHEGSSVHPERQTRSYPHSAYVNDRYNLVYVPDLGIDRIKVYTPDVEAMKLIPAGETVVAAGSGPRHMAFHPQLPVAYVIGELDCTITVLNQDTESGRLAAAQAISTLPGDFQGENTCAEVAITPDGRFVYGSNRGHDSIAVYAADAATGQLTLIDIVPSLGAVPRNFSLSPDGRFLIAAHQDTGNLVVFKIDSETGVPQDTGYRAEADRGVCVRFWKE